MGESVDERVVARQAIDKARANGWRPRPQIERVPEEFVDSFDVWLYGIKKITFFTDDMSRVQIPIYEIIFSHSFAKALWGEKEVDHFDLVDLDNGGTTTTIKKPIWHYHLQQMVIADNPFQYLKEHI